MIVNYIYDTDPSRKTFKHREITFVPFLIQFLFATNVVAKPHILRQNLNAIVWVLCIYVLLLGWKHTYVVYDISLGLMAYVSAFEILYNPHPTSEHSPNKID